MGAALVQWCSVIMSCTPMHVVYIFSLTVLLNTFLQHMFKFETVQDKRIPLCLKRCSKANINA